MDQYPVEDAATSSNNEKMRNDDMKRPAEDVPKLNIASFKGEDKKKSTESEDISIASKPKIKPDPIMLRPQESPLTKGEQINQQRYVPEQMQTPEEEVSTHTSTYTTQTPTYEKPREIVHEAVKETPIKMPTYPQYTPQYRHERDFEFDEKGDVEKQKRDLFFSKLKEQIEKRNSGTAETISLDRAHLIESMKAYQHNIMQKEDSLREKQKVDSVIADNITALELLEEGWYMLRKEIEAKQQLLIQKEKMIDKIIVDLKKIMEEERVSDKEATLKEIPPDKWFVLKDGKKLKSLSELKETLRTIEDYTFYHHVNELKNDFSSWIRHVFEDAKLADKISLAKTKEELIAILEQN